MLSQRKEFYDIKYVSCWPFRSLDWHTFLSGIRIYSFSENTWKWGTPKWSLCQVFLYFAGYAGVFLLCDHLSSKALCRRGKANLTQFRCKLLCSLLLINNAIKLEETSELSELWLQRNTVTQYVLCLDQSLCCADSYLISLEHVRLIVGLLKLILKAELPIRYDNSVHLKKNIYPIYQSVDF